MDIFKNSKSRENIDYLEGPGQTLSVDYMGRQIRNILTLEEDLSLVRPKMPRNEIKQRRLAGAVGAYHRRHHTRLYLETHIVNSMQFAEGLA